MRAFLLCCCAILLAVSNTFAQDTSSIQQAYYKAKSTHVKSVSELAANARKITPEPKKQLELLMFWAADNMKADSVRFFSRDNSTISSDAAFRKRSGLCEDYAGIFHDYCKSLNIPVVNVEGYVKEYDFKYGSMIKEANHIWNVAFVDNKWQLFDLFWTTSVLEVNSSGVKSFRKRLKQDYFFAEPDKFINTHMPCDPVFQLLEQPFSIKAFSALEAGVSGTMDRLPAISFQGSIQKLYKMPPRDRAISIAEHAYAFNPNNYRLPIVEHYNYGISVINNTAASPKDMGKAKQSFQRVVALAEKSGDDANLDLIPVCKDNIDILSGRMKQVK